tara:strand:- start:71 stop:202 length:132 start_codon:yes stop_codon:yes gene_type:complete
MVLWLVITQNVIVQIVLMKNAIVMEIKNAYVSLSQSVVAVTAN